MMKKLSVVLFFFCHLAFADCLLYESKEYANEGAEAYRESCESYGGGGGKFSYSVSESSSNNTCDGAFAENAFILRVSCNTCDSREMKEELEENKKYCNEICKTPMMTCMTTLNAWGSTLNGSRESCGLEDHSLPGCEESSSSSEPKSSSSESSSSSSSFEEKSSSSEALSSSEAMSSSIDNNPFGYQESIHVCSTDVSFFRLAYNHCKTNEVADCNRCYNTKSNPIKYFTKKPNYYGKLEYSTLCFANQGEFAIKTNLPYINIERNFYVNCFDDVESCERGNGIRGYVSSIRLPVVYGCMANDSRTLVSMDPQKGCSVTENTTQEFWGVFFWGSSMNELSSIASLEWRNTDPMYLPSNFSLDDLLKEPSIVESFERCRESLKYYNSLKSSSSQSGSSSSIVETSSSNEDEFSSSSSEGLSSSSDEMLQSSSSEEKWEPISSSENSAACFQFPVGNTPSNYNSACFEKDGVCYKCNGARGKECGSDWLWSGYFNYSDYWYTKVNCQTGEEIINKVGKCYEYPMNSIPENPGLDCIAVNGTCYKCNSDNMDCSQSWIWTNGFHIDSWVYTEVDCNTGRSKDDDDCPDISIVLQKEANGKSNKSVNEINDVDFTKTSKVYDVLGRIVRKANKYDKVYEGGRMKNYQKHNMIKKENSMSSYDLTYFDGMSVECGYNSKRQWICQEVGDRKFLKKSESVAENQEEECGVEGGDYGIIEPDGSRTGGITCTQISYAGYKAKRKHDDLIIGNKRTVTITLIANSVVLSKNEPHFVKKGYVFSEDGYITTEKDALMMKFHEKGHVAYNKCIKFPVYSKDYTETIENDECADSYAQILANESAPDFLEYVAKKTKELLDRSLDLFHEKYGHSGSKEYTDSGDKVTSPRAYVCPSELSNH